MPDEAVVLFRSQSRWCGNEAGRLRYGFRNRSRLLNDPQAVNEMVDAGLAIAAHDNAPAYQSPVKGCFFFATPHQGSGLANSYATVLSLLKGVLILGTGPSDTLIRELKEKATEFARISEQFDQVRHGHQIETISCFEQKKILGQIVRSIMLTAGAFGLMWSIGRPSSLCSPGLRS